MSSLTSAQFATATPDPSQGLGFGPAPNQTATYLQSIVISLVALAIILVISIIFYYYRKRRLRQYSAAEWPFPTNFRSNARRTGGGRNREVKDYGKKPEMWEVEVRDGEKWDGVDCIDGRKGSMGSLTSLMDDIGNWQPISAIAVNEISNNDTKPHTIDTTSQTISSTSSISSVQFSLLIAMPSPPPYTTNPTIHREDENFPDVEIGFCCVDVDKVTKDVRPQSGVGVPMRRQVEGMNSTSVIPDVADRNIWKRG